MAAARSTLSALWLALLLAGCASVADCPPGALVTGAAGEPAPEAGSGFAALPLQEGRQQMVVTANPFASEAAREILRKGGSAIDAAIAATMVLTLVEPQSAGIGGGGFLLHYAGASRAVSAYEGRETAPAAAKPDRFLGPDGEPLEFEDAQSGGISVGVPGLLAMFALAHERHGRLPWRSLFEPAIALAESGFPISPRLHALLAEDEMLRQSPTAARYFYRPDGTPRPEGEILRNPALARTLALIAEEGTDPFYRGAIAARMVAAVQNAWRHPGDLALGDLAAYEARAPEALCGDYRRWRVCAPPPPSSGGVALLQILDLLEPYGLGRMAPESPEAVHLVAEASRLAFADRAAYLADADFVAVPVAGLLDEDYLETRGDGIHRACSMGPAAPGTPPDAIASALPPAGFEPVSTTQVSIVDRFGDAVSLTASIESAFGAHIMVDGFLLNNQLTDFAFRPTGDSGPVANRLEPGKRPRSSMTPTIVLDEHGKLAAVTGSPGGSSIIGYVAKALVAMLDWKLDPAAAAALPNFLNRNGPTELEADTPLVALAAALQQRGHDVRIATMTSGINSILVLPDGRLQGGGDPRRESAALGD